ncbi:hypothetical protein Tsubulata_023966 [Turnera subulata]|uniref:Reticulon-like protein n=1 Tax=Turnera subulata TaxID=218843 RepID=A0A9Q0F7U1_9ROSI|nr:hypothetical protein Tsubulata_023966 [Turnera subulata]
MPAIIYPTDSEDEVTMPRARLFGRQRPVHAVLGGGQVADVLLWRNKRISAALFMGMSLLWFLFEVVEYNFVTLFCHISITTMLIVFIWRSGAEFFGWKLPVIPKSVLDRSTFQDAALTFHVRFNQALSKLIDIACGKDPALFFLAIICLYILSVIGNYFTFLNFMYLCFVCCQTLPFLYERYEDEVDYFVSRSIRQVKKMFKVVDSNVLNKIPRGPVKEKKSR